MATNASDAIATMDSYTATGYERETDRLVAQSLRERSDAVSAEYSAGLAHFLERAAESVYHAPDGRTTEYRGEPGDNRLPRWRVRLS
jgi:hypothetical protein